ncbi:hypothetical protein D9M69_426800 [compost metagenome]
MLFVGADGYRFAQPHPMYGLAFHCQPAFEQRNPVASMYQASAREPPRCSGPTLSELAQCQLRRGLGASRMAGIIARRSDLGSMFSAAVEAPSAPVAGTRGAIRPSQPPAGQGDCGCRGRPTAAGPRRCAGCGWPDGPPPLCVRGAASSGSADGRRPPRNQP